MACFGSNLTSIKANDDVVVIGVELLATGKAVTFTTLVDDVLGIACKVRQCWLDEVGVLHREVSIWIMEQVN